MEVFHKQTHHQHVLLCGAEGLLKRQPVTVCTNTQQPITFQDQRHACRAPKAANPSPQSRSPVMELRGLTSIRFIHLELQVKANLSAALWWWAVVLTSA